MGECGQWACCLAGWLHSHCSSGNPDRGWNDPPKLAFSPAGTGTPAGSGRHRLLSKRVPIPLNPQDGTTPSPLPPSLKSGDGPLAKGGMPLRPPPVCPCPPLAFNSPLTPVAAAASSGGELENPMESQEKLEQVQTSLLDSLNCVSEKLKESTLEEIRKRLSVMADMWQNDQLSLEVQKRMMALSEGLSQQDHDKAWALHQSLIVDYTTTCSPWMVGVKTLIAESRRHSEPKSKKGKLHDDSSKKSEAEMDSARKESSVSGLPSAE